MLAADARKVATPGPFVPRVFGELPGIDLAGLPPLNAYAMTSPRPEAELLLLIGPGDPLLAWHRHGKGVTVAFTSAAPEGEADGADLWEGEGRFWSGLCRHAVRHVPRRPAAVAVPAASDPTAPAAIPDELHIGLLNEELLRRVAEVSGGEYSPSPAKIFAPSGRTAVVTTPLWRYLLMICAVVFVADVAVRRWRHAA